MSAKTIVIKKRPIKNQIYISTNTLKQFIDKKDKDGLFDLFKEALEGGSQFDSDIKWLRLVASYLPGGRGSVVDHQLWLPFLVRINQLDEDQDGGTFTIPQRYVDLFWSRITNKEFEITGGLSTTFAEFLMDFAEQTGKQFTDKLDWDEGTPGTKKPTSE